jgi:hypothetical protein
MVDSVGAGGVMKFHYMTSEMHTGLLRRCDDLTA